jgi:hypothetical protein
VIIREAVRALVERGLGRPYVMVLRVKVLIMYLTGCAE